MRNRKFNPVAAAVGTAFVASMAVASVAQADASTNPFETTQMEAGYDLLAKHHEEGKCGEGKCGEGSCGEGSGDKDGEGKCGEGKCGEGKCGEGSSDKDGEGKCGEGKCGSA
ncbi:MAG: hypothetical protein NXH85_18475 [Pseudomonadaceae bacterium]|nr:hypothetical protein [Pseudomonadaceae bacterium]